MINQFSGTFTIDLSTAGGVLNAQIGDEFSFTLPIVNIAAYPLSDIGIFNGPFSWAWNLDARFPEGSGGIGIGLLGNIPSTALLPLPLNNYDLNFFDLTLQTQPAIFLNYNGVITSLIQIDTSQFAFSGHGGLPLPEPSTWALLLLAFAFFGLRQVWPGASHE